MRSAYLSFLACALAALAAPAYPSAAYSVPAFPTAFPSSPVVPSFPVPSAASGAMPSEYQSPRPHACDVLT